MTAGRTVYAVVPAGIDDPALPSGGNTYDRRVCDGLVALGWSVHERGVPGSWPRPDAQGRAGLADVLRAIPEGAVVLLDGLVASAVPEEIVPHAERLRLVVLVHLPLGDGEPDVDGAIARTSESASLVAARHVVTTSRWTRSRVLDLYGLRPDRVHVATPGVDPAGLSPGTETGRELLCVAAVTPGKGHDVLLEALAAIGDLAWHCDCVGSLDRDPVFVARLERQARVSGLDGRVVFTGPRTGAELAASYAAADVLVLASRGETYGMVVTEALARGLPAVATAVGGLPEALGYGVDGQRPGLLVAPDDPEALAAALRCWLGDADARRRLRAAARERRDSLADWRDTSLRLAQVLVEAAA